MTRVDIDVVGLCERDRVVAPIRWIDPDTVRLMRRRVRYKVQRCLTGTQARYVELVFYRGMSTIEASRACGVNQSSVVKGLQRAVERLRSEMGVA